MNRSIALTGVLLITSVSIPIQGCITIQGLAPPNRQKTADLFVPARAMPYPRSLNASTFSTFELAELARLG
jgi:hypothetical protein